MMPRLLLATLLLIQSLTFVVVGAEGSLDECRECQNTETSDWNDTFDEQQEPSNSANHDNGGSLFLAPSSIPGAGLGVYTMVDIPKGGIVGGDDYADHGDLFVPILDHYKVLPYKGQQRFLSWLAYIWPKEQDAFYHSRWEDFFPKIPETFHRIPEGLSGVNPEESLQFFLGTNTTEDMEAVSAFVPGLASMVNTHSFPSQINIEKANIYQKSNEEQDHPGVGAYTSHYGVAFVATKDIEAGSELFLDYGGDWCERYSDVPMFESEAQMWKFRQDVARDMSLVSMPTERGKRRRMANMGMEINQLMGNTNIPGHVPNPIFSRVYAHSGDDVSGEDMDHFDEEEEDDDDDEDDEDDEEEDSDDDDEEDDEDEDENEDEDTVWSGREGRIKSSMFWKVPQEKARRLYWIKKRGMSIDNLRAGPSQVHPIAGRGAFAKRFMPNGSVIAPSPLLVLKRDDLLNYKVNKNKSLIRNFLNLKKVVGQDLLKNYCYGHPDSELLLLPYAPMVNFINHGGQEANAEIRWPSKTSPWFAGSRDWFSMQPLDVQDWSGPYLKVEFVALRDIQPGEEILIDYGSAWEDAWNEHVDYFIENFDRDNAETAAEIEPFRHEIGVPNLFYPREWKHKSMVYQIAPLESPLEPGEVSQMRFAHNSEPIAKNLYRVGLPRGFSAKVKEYSDQLGISGLYETLLSARGDEKIMEDNEWQVFETQGEQWFAQRHQSKEWSFNMHYIAPWDEPARKSMLSALGQAGFDVALEGTAKHLGLENMTCWHSSFMGVSLADSVSRPHADVYSTGEKGFNYIFPLLLVNGSLPELDIQTDDHNVLIGVNYEYDVAYALGDFVYHKTRGIKYDDKNQIRIMVGAYCSQINAGDERITAYIYHGEDPAPFMDQFTAPIKEAHYGNGRTLPKVEVAQ